MLLSVAPNPAAETDKTESPLILNRHQIEHPPSAAVQALSLPATSRWFARRNDGSHHHVIISTGSGTGLATSVWKTLISPALEALGIQQDRDYTLHTTTSPTFITKLAQSTILPAANAGIPQSIALLSGDGGLLDLLNALLTAPSPREPTYIGPTVALLPLGTGNATAHSTGLTRDNTLGLRTWLRGTTSRPLPYFRARFSPGAHWLEYSSDEDKTVAVPMYKDPASSAPTAYGAVVLSWAVHAGLVADSDTPAYRKFGRERFTMAAKEALFPKDGGAPHVYRGKVSVALPTTSDADGKDNGEETWTPLRTDDMADQHTYLLATFMAQLEKGFLISPASKPLDGKLRLVSFGPVSGEEAMGIMTKAFQGGGHVEDPRVGYQEVKAVKIEVDEKEERWRRICVDGKIVVSEEGGWVEVRAVEQEGKGVVDVVMPLENA